jgi:hypothetical protein
VVSATVPTAVNLGFLVILTRLSGPSFRPTTQKILYRWESNPGPLDLYPVEVSPITSPKGKGLLPSSRLSSVKLMG